MSRRTENIDRIVNIYILLDPRDTEFNPRYVGITVQSVERRLQKHISDSNKYRLRVSNWIKQLKRQGLLPIVKLADSVIGWDSACYIEKSLIRIFRNLGFDLCNLTDGGEGALGSPRPKSIEWREKMSKMFSGINSPCYGKPISEEHKQKQSLLMKGRKLSKEHRDKVVAVLNRIKYTDERREKVSIANSKRPKITVECPYCGKHGSKMIMSRWHFDNCKFNKL